MSAKGQSTSAIRQKLLDEIQCHIRSSRSDGEKCDYVLWTSVANIVNLENVKRVFQEDHNIETPEQADYEDIQKILDKSPKIFLISIRGHVSTRFILSNNLRDENLPFDEQALSSTSDKTSVERFKDAQHILISDQHRSSLKTIKLPTSSSRKCGDPIFYTSNGKCGVPIDYQDKLGNGAFASVCQAQIDQTCYSIDRLASDPEKPDFSRPVAIKEFPQERVKHWETEQKFVKRLRKYEISHHRLALPYAGFTVCHMQSPKQKRYTRCFILERTNYDLDQYMGLNDKNPTQRSFEKRAKWFFCEAMGLAKALNVVHAPRNANGRFGYHHDIKPHNILVFEEEEKLTLKFTDWGCARFVEHPEASIGPLSFSPPERTINPKTSTPHDIWSLGCLFVLILVWLTESSDSRLRFQEASGQTWFKHDSLSLSDCVEAKLKELETFDDGGWAGAVDVIRQMFEIDPGKRIKACQVSKALREVSDRARIFD